jgi:hypothetical protein
MQMSPTCNRIVYSVLIGMVLPLCAGILQGESAPAAPEENAEGGNAVVYVIDNSTSMVWIQEEMKEILKDVINKSKPKDSISIVFFGEKASTLASYKSIDEQKKEALCRIVDTASANSLYTCFSPAIERGVELLYDYFRDAAADKYILLMVSDGKEHPPPGYVKDHSLEEVLRQHPDFIPGKDWDFCYLALREQVDSELVSLVKKYGGDFYNSGEISHLLDINEEEVVESIIQNPRDWNELEAFVSDHFGQVEIRKTGENNWVKIQQVRYKLLAGDQIAVKKDAKAVITVGSIARLGLGEETAIKLDKAENLPLKQKANIRIGLQKGTLLNSVRKTPESETTYEVLTPIALTSTRGTDFRVSYEDDILEEVVSVFAGSAEIRPPGGGSYKKEVIVEAGNQSVILAGNLPTPPSPIPRDVLEEWNKWKKALLQKMSLQQIHFTPVIVKPLLDKIVLGPIKANQKYSAEIPLQFSEKYRGEDPLSALTMISLPPGVEVLTEVKDDEENELRKSVHVSLSCQSFLRYIGHEMYSGFINLDCKNPDIVFTMNSIPLQVLQKRPTLRSG